MTVPLILNKGQVRQFLLHLALFLTFIGNIKLWFGTSALVLPLGLIPLIVVLVFIRTFWLPELPIVALLLVAGCAIIGMLTNTTPNFLRAIASMAPWFVTIFALFIAVNVRYSERLHIFLDWGSIVLAGLVCIEFIQIYQRSTLFYEIKISIETPLGGSNYLGAFLVFCLLRNSFRSKWLTLISLVALIATLSRTSLAIGCVLLVIRLLWERRTRRFGFSLLFVCFIVASIFMQSILTLVNRIPGFLILESAKLRLGIWEIVLREIAKRPFFGLGPGGQRAALDHFEGQSLWDSHNAILSLAVTFGVIGLIFYLIYFAYGIWAIHRVSRHNRAWKGIFWGMIALASAAMFETVVFSVGYEILFALLVGQALSLRRQLRIASLSPHMSSRYVFTKPSQVVTGSFNT